MSRNHLNKGISLILAAVIGSSLLSACGSNPEKNEVSNSTQSASTVSSSENSLKGTLTAWYWDDADFKNTATIFNKEYPEIKLENTTVAISDYLKKVQTSVAAGMELPDLLYAEISQRGKLFDMNIWEDLEAAPYNFDKSQYFDYVIPTMQNPDGKIVGLEGTLNPAGLTYNRAIAKEYLGTDDPDKIEAMLTDWDALIKIGKQIKEKSGGKIYAFASMGDAQEILEGQSPIPLISGNTFNATETVGKELEVLVKMRDAGIVDKLDAWTPAWSASIGSGKYLFYPCVPWFITSQIEPNDKDSKISWGLVTPPGGAFSFGGTTTGITKTSKNKELAWTFMKWNYLSLDGASARKTVGSFVPYKAAYNDPAFASDKNPRFGGQDIGEKFFNQFTKSIKIRPQTKYDASYYEIYDLILKAVNKDNKWDAATALAKYKTELKKKIPDIEIK